MRGVIERQQAAIARLADRLGLSYRRFQPVEGDARGGRLWIDRASPPSLADHIRVGAKFRIATDLRGLIIRRADRESGQWREPFEPPERSLADASLAWLEVQGPEDISRVDAWLDADEIPARLRALDDVAGLRIERDRVSARVPYYANDDAFDRAIDLLVAAAAVLDRGRARIPVHPNVAHALSDIRRVADEFGLDLSLSALGASGHVARCPVLVFLPNYGPFSGGITFLDVEAPKSARVPLWTRIAERMFDALDQWIPHRAPGSRFVTRQRARRGPAGSLDPGEGFSLVSARSDRVIVATVLAPGQSRDLGRVLRAIVSRLSSEPIATAPACVPADGAQPYR